MKQAFEEKSQLSAAGMGQYLNQKNKKLKSDKESSCTASTGVGWTQSVSNIFEDKDDAVTHSFSRNSSKPMGHRIQMKQIANYQRYQRQKAKYQCWAITKLELVMVKSQCCSNLLFWDYYLKQYEKEYARNEPFRLQWTEEAREAVGSSALKRKLEPCLALMFGIPQRNSAEWWPKAESREWESHGQGLAKALQEPLKGGCLQANSPAETGTMTSPFHSVGRSGPMSSLRPMKLKNTQPALRNAQMGVKLDLKPPLISDMVKVLTAYCSYDTLSSPWARKLNSRGEFTVLLQWKYED